jgi:excisionase family DNA binding protein
VKVEVQFDTQELVALIAQAVVKEIKPLLGKATNGEESLFTVKTLAEYLQVSQQWVYERIQRHEIPYIKMGKFPRFKKSAINHWLDTQKIPASEPLSRPLIVGRPRKRRGPTE